nr:MAG TPA: hypothetical protein [Caudoviricetes sp.]
MRSFDAQREQCCLECQCELRRRPQLTDISLRGSFAPTSRLQGQSSPHGDTYTLIRQLVDDDNTVIRSKVIKCTKADDSDYTQFIHRSTQTLHRL